MRECVVKPHEANNIGSLLTDAKFEPHEANSIEDTGRWERLRTEWGVYKGHSECVVRECVLRVAAHEANSIEDTGSLLTDVQVASAHEALNDYNHYKAQLLDEEAIAAMMIAEDELECTLEVRPDQKKTKKKGLYHQGL